MAEYSGNQTVEWKVGDVIYDHAGDIGIVRHIGELSGEGSPTSLWSEWGKEWDSKVLTKRQGGQLLYAEPEEVSKTPTIPSLNLSEVYSQCVTVPVPTSSNDSLGIEVDNEEDEKVESESGSEFKVGDIVTVTEACSGCVPGVEYPVFEANTGGLVLRKPNGESGCGCTKRWRLVIKVPKVVVNLSHTILPKEHLSLIKEAIAQSRKEVGELIFNTWGFGETITYGKGVGILLWGPPGTGKTQTAMGIAGELGKDYLILGNAELQSSVPGQMERNIAKGFKDAKEKGLVVILDECDSLLASRNSVGVVMAGEINYLLITIEKFEGVCIMTTNRAPVLDEALERRLALKLEFKPPTTEERLAIWRKLIPEKCPLVEVNLSELAKYNLTGGQIKNAILTGARKAASHTDTKGIAQSDLEVGVKMELLGRKAWEEGKGYSPLKEIMEISRGIGEKEKREGLDGRGKE